MAKVRIFHQSGIKVSQMIESLQKIHEEHGDMTISGCDYGHCLRVYLDNSGIVGKANKLSNDHRKDDLFLAIY